MKIQKTLKCFALATVAGLLVSNAVAQQVTVSQIPGYFVPAGPATPNAGDGEFNVTPIRGAGYGADALVGGGFQTFCINRDAGITLPGNYFDTLSPAGIIIPGNLTVSKGSVDVQHRIADGIQLHALKPAGQKTG